MVKEIHNYVIYSIQCQIRTQQKNALEMLNLTTSVAVSLHVHNTVSLQEPNHTRDKSTNYTPIYKDLPVSCRHGRYKVSKLGRLTQRSQRGQQLVPSNDAKCMNPIVLTHL